MLLDQDVEAVAAFMQANVPATKLLSVADTISKLAPLLWGHYPRAEVQWMALTATPQADGSHTQSAATGYTPGWVRQGQ